MKCPTCGKLVHVHIHDPVTGRFDKAWCRACRKFLKRGAGRACAHCANSFEAFERSGFFDCEFCYATFYDKLIRTLPSIDVRRHALDPLASARTLELQTLLGADNGAWPNPEGEESFPADPSAGEEIPAVESAIRIRLARNVAGIPYLHRLAPPLRRILSEVLLSRGAILGRWQADGQLTGRSYSSDEDHLRVEWFVPLSDSEAHVEARLSAIASEIERIDSLFDWQWHRDFGYLAACPSNSGLGIRISMPWPSGRSVPHDFPSLEKAKKGENWLVSARIRSGEWREMARALMTGIHRPV